jgi:hypothetical protein
MNNIYKKLMIQYGGQIPFEVLGGVGDKKTHKKQKPKKTKKKTKRIPSINRKYNPINYPIGVIIEYNRSLWRVNPSNQWEKL